jgi:hypothetical protein
MQSDPKGAKKRARSGTLPPIPVLKQDYSIKILNVPGGNGRLERRRIDGENGRLGGGGPGDGGTMPGLAAVLAPHLLVLQRRQDDVHRALGQVLGTRHHLGGVSSELYIEEKSAKNRNNCKMLTKNSVY